MLIPQRISSFKRVAPRGLMKKKALAVDPLFLAFRENVTDLISSIEPDTDGRRCILGQILHDELIINLADTDATERSYIELLVPGEFTTTVFHDEMLKRRLLRIEECAVVQSFIANLFPMNGVDQISASALRSELSASFPGSDFASSIVPDGSSTRHFRCAEVLSALEKCIKCKFSEDLEEQFRSSEGLVEPDPPHLAKRLVATRSLDNIRRWILDIESRHEAKLTEIEDELKELKKLPLVMRKQEKRVGNLECDVETALSTIESKREHSILDETSRLSRQRSHSEHTTTGKYAGTFGQHHGETHDRRAKWTGATFSTAAHEKKVVISRERDASCVPRMSEQPVDHRSVGTFDCTSITFPSSHVKSCSDQLFDDVGDCLFLPHQTASNCPSSTPGQIDTEEFGATSSIPFPLRSDYHESSESHQTLRSPKGSFVIRVQPSLASPSDYKRLNRSSRSSGCDSLEYSAAATLRARGESLFHTTNSDTHKDYDCMVPCDNEETRAINNHAAPSDSIRLVDDSSDHGNVLALLAERSPETKANLVSDPYLTSDLSGDSSNATAHGIVPEAIAEGGVSGLQKRLTLLTEKFSDMFPQCFDVIGRYFDVFRYFDVRHDDEPQATEIQIQTRQRRVKLEIGHTVDNASTLLAHPKETEFRFSERIQNWTSTSKLRTSLPYVVQSIDDFLFSVLPQAVAFIMFKWTKLLLRLFVLIALLQCAVPRFRAISSVPPAMITIVAAMVVAYVTAIHTIDSGVEHHEGFEVIDGYFW